jgi:hypothetical protein
MDNMTPEEEAEWLYRYTERLGMMCEDKMPLESQMVIAAREADAALLEFRLARLRKAER